uniref:Uncharacterized protein n=1 Tax=Avena sativa TaxID=4498 RepID=A0ACD5WZP4_AVESA
MPAPLAASWRRHASAVASSSTPRTLLLLLPVLILLLLVLSRPPDLNFYPIIAAPRHLPAHLRPFDCYASPQASPVFASLVEGVPRPFFYSLADTGSLPDRPHKNVARILKGKRFRKPDISETIQELLAGKLARPSGGVVVDVGANVGMAAFAAAVMGFRVVAFEPVFENLLRICDGIYLNRGAPQWPALVRLPIVHGIDCSRAMWRGCRRVVTLLAMGGAVGHSLGGVLWYLMAERQHGARAFMLGLPCLHPHQCLAAA